MIIRQFARLLVFSFAAYVPAHAGANDLGHRSDAASRGLANWQCAWLLEFSGADETHVEEHFALGWAMLKPVADDLLQGKLSDAELAAISLMLITPDPLNTDGNFLLGMVWRDIQDRIRSELNSDLSTLSVDAPMHLRQTHAASAYDRANCLLILP